MFYVYILKSLVDNQIYIGCTDNLPERIANHNRGSTFHTAKFRPWKLESSISFNSKSMALKFEKYLKSCSGRAFIAKRLLEDS